MFTKAVSEEQAIVFLDYAKAFDKVSHKMLLHKLESYGISWKLNAWISAFMSGRSQRVVLGETVSDWCRVTNGAPHGSVLGPTLFFIYINDMPDNINSPLRLFADDSKILANIDLNNPDASINILQEDIDNITKLDKWLMQLNFEKCKVMHIGKRNPMALHNVGSSF